MKSNKEIYQAQLQNILTTLRETVNQLQTIIINLAMSGELEEMNDLFDENDNLEFKYEDFRDLTDHNVRLMYQVYDFLLEKRAQVMNVNGLEDDELEF